MCVHGGLHHYWHPLTFGFGTEIGINLTIFEKEEEKGNIDHTFNSFRSETKFWHQLFAKLV